MTLSFWFCGYIGELRTELQAPMVKHRGSYTSVHVFFEFIKQVGKSDKMRGWPPILALFCNKFNKLNNTGAQMLDSTYDI